MITAPRMASTHRKERVVRHLSSARRPWRFRIARDPGLVAGLFRLSILLIFTTGTLLAGPRDAQWKAVEDAVNRGLPKTAITNLEPIIQGALMDKAYAEAVKAIGKKIALEGNIQGNKPEEKITRLEAEIAKAPREMVPVMDTLLAHWYWHYFQQNDVVPSMHTAQGQSNTISVELRGNSFRFLVNNVPVHTDTAFTDTLSSPFTSGEVGLSVEEGEVVFSNMYITRLP